MKRRNFIEYAATGAVGATALGACRSEKSPSTTAVALDLPVIQWRMATSWPKSLQILYESADLLCRQVSKMTDGRFAITPYPAGELADGLKVLDAVADGTVECGHSASYYYLDRGPALAFGTTIPFGLTAIQQNAWLYYGGGLETMRKLYADLDLGVINFPGGNTGAQMGGWFKREVNAIEDFQGLKMRVPGLGGQILERLGAEIQVLAGDKIFEALEKGLIDAAEWKNPHADEMLGLNRVAPLYYYPGWWEPGTSYEFQVNLNQWQQLPKEYQDIFQAAATDVNAKMLAKFNAVNGQVLENMVLGGTTLLPFSQEILKATYQTAFEFYEEIASQDTTFKNIYEPWKVFRDRIYGWNKLNELSFANFAIDLTNS